MQSGFGTSLPKTTFGTKISGVWARGASKIKFGTAYLFLQLLKLATSNLVYNLGLGLSYQKQRLKPKLAGAWARGASEKIWTPLFISATIEASDWKIGTQHELRFTLPNTSFRVKLDRVWVKRVPLPSPLWWWWCNCVFYVPSKTDRYPD